MGYVFTDKDRYFWSFLIFSQLRLPPPPFPSNLNRSSKSLIVQTYTLQKDLLRGLHFLVKYVLILTENFEK